jgi:nucleotide-binding universal stress UspA family protein
MSESLAPPSPPSLESPARGSAMSPPTLENHMHVVASPGRTSEKEGGRHSLFDRIVVPVNGYPPNERAIPIATVLARQLGGEMEFASMLYSDAHREERTQLLHRLASRIHLPAFTTIEEGSDPAAFILDLINRERHLVVLAGGTTILGIPGSITVEAMRFAAHPFVAVGPKIGSFWHGPIERIVVLLDGSPTAESSLVTAVRWAKATGALIELVQVLDPDDVRRASIIAPDVCEGGYLETMAENLEADCSRPVSFEVLHANAHWKVRVINEYVNAHQGSIVCMASNGAHHSRSMVASTTVRMVHDATVPVLIVRS